MRKYTSTNFTYSPIVLFTSSFAHNQYKYQREKCPYSELFWSTFSRIRIEHGEILRSDYSNSFGQLYSYCFSSPV